MFCKNNPANIRLDEDVLRLCLQKTSSRRLAKTFSVRLQDIFKTSCKDLFKTFSKLSLLTCIQNDFETYSKRF